MRMNEEKEPNREVLWDALNRAYPLDVVSLATSAEWDNLNDCWLVYHNNMWLGIEKDGYIHS